MPDSRSSTSFYSILILGSEDVLHSSFINKLLKDATAYGSRNVVLKVVSPRGTPYYIEQVRNLLLSNIHLSITAEYAGSYPEDVKKVVEELRESQGLRVKVYVSSEVQNRLLDMIENLEVEYDMVDGR
ncbi:MAG: DUF5751 family protein [Zestosphaera sp.]